MYGSRSIVRFRLVYEDSYRNFFTCNRKVRDEQQEPPYLAARRIYDDRVAKRRRHVHRQSVRTVLHARTVEHARDVFELLRQTISRSAATDRRGEIN